MGDYLLLRWLETRRGFTIFVLLVLITAFANLYRFASHRENAGHYTLKVIHYQTAAKDLPKR